MRNLITRAAALACLATAASADDGVHSDAGSATPPPFDILEAHVETDGGLLTFHMKLVGIAGAETPAPAGQLAGAPVWSYVWPTSLDPASVGFEPGTGILALAATSHPDFDDTPLFDEDANGRLDDDGANWHVHWVVLAPTEACGTGALAVRDIPEGETPRLPATWPGLPLFIDSPGYTPVFSDDLIAVRIPNPGVDFSYDGVTSALRVNASVHAPLLCVTDVFDVASGDLSLPGRIDN